MERPQAWRHEAACLAQDPHPLPGRRSSNRREGELTSKRWKYELPSSPPATSAPVKTIAGQRMRPCYPNSSTRSHPSRRSPALPPPLRLKTIRATDGAFDTRKCHEAMPSRGAAAVIPPRKNAKPWKPDTAGAVARNEALRASKHLGRTLWRRWSGYNRRSQVETKMHCVKLLGQRLIARDFDRQVAEFQVRVAVLNGFTALGIPVTKIVGWVRPG